MPLVISGPLGVGKSDFALRLAHDLAPGMFDGQLYADLGASEPPDDSSRTVLRGFLEALCERDQIPDTAEQQAGLYRSLLGRRRLLVLLDNVRSEQQVRPLLAEIPHGVLIAVSRNPLLGLRDVRRMELGVLTRHASVGLIQSVAGERAEAEPEACARLAESCGDLPLALDVAARKLALIPTQAVGDVVGSVLDGGALPGWLRLGDIDVRDQLLSAYKTLTAPASKVFWQLHHAGFDDFAVSTAVRTFGISTTRTEELLEELAEAGMVRRGEMSGKYRLDSLLRAFADELTVISSSRHPRQGPPNACQGRVAAGLKRSHQRTA